MARDFENVLVIQGIARILLELHIMSYSLYLSLGAHLGKLLDLLLVNCCLVIAYFSVGNRVGSNRNPLAETTGGKVQPQDLQGEFLFTNYLNTQVFWMFVS